MEVLEGMGGGWWRVCFGEGGKGGRNVEKMGWGLGGALGAGKVFFFSSLRKK